MNTMLLPENSWRSNKATAGAYATFASSPTSGTASLAEPSVSTTMYRSSFAKSSGCAGGSFALRNRVLSPFARASSFSLEATPTKRDFPRDANKNATITIVIDSRSCARRKYGSFDDRVDQKALETITASVISDPSNTFTEVSNVGSVDKAESELEASIG